MSPRTIKTLPEDLVEKALKLHYFNMFKELDKITSKELKESIKIMSHQIRNIKTKQEIIKKEPNRNYEVEKYSKKSHLEGLKSNIRQVELSMNFKMG